MATVFASGADERYGWHLLNAIGSVRANSNLFDLIAVYDLGLSRFQRTLLDRVRGVEIRRVPPFVPHWGQGRTWKTWIWTHSGADVLFWLDAGATVLRPLDEPLEQIERRGYFAVSQSHPLRDSLPRDWYSRYDITEDQAARTQIAAGIIGFRTSGLFYDKVIVPTFEDAAEGRSLGFSADEVDKLNIGLDRLEPVIVRDCPLFRHEQTLLNIHFYRAISDPVVNDVYKFGGWMSSTDHPEQVIWSHRRRGDYRYLPRIPFEARVALFGRAWGLWFRWRWWAKKYSWLFRPSIYLRKAKRLAAVGRLR